LNYKKEIAVMARAGQFPQYFAYLHGSFDSLCCDYHQSTCCTFRLLY
jgi:hypothetical protein